ncbi:hypothetical protein PUN4_700054 [Paraburkholderia unamae]|nr:hypothetical protein PUN4_700054 [Paraburkholderia unamae]
MFPVPSYEVGRAFDPTPGFAVFKFVRLAEHSPWLFCRQISSRYSLHY